MASLEHYKAAAVQKSLLSLNYKLALPYRPRMPISEPPRRRTRLALNRRRSGTGPNPLSPVPRIATPARGSIGMSPMGDATLIQHGHHFGRTIDTFACLLQLINRGLSISNALRSQQLSVTASSRKLYESTATFFDRSSNDVEMCELLAWWD
ncbi:hypothetical protein DXG01_011775, partial [Tephrocybe rancida]